MKGKDVFLNWATSHMFELLAGQRTAGDAAN